MENVQQEKQDVPGNQENDELGKLQKKKTRNDDYWYFTIEIRNVLVNSGTIICNF